MFIYIPAEIVALVTFPGVIVHEIAHRFFCDIQNVPVYGIDYFNLLSKRAGGIVHHRSNARRSFFIAAGPLIINSLLCIILTFPVGTKWLLGTSFANTHSAPFETFLAWIGYSTGFHAIPSNQDVEGLANLAESNFAKTFLALFSGLIQIFNVNYIGVFLQIGFAAGLSMLVPALLYNFVW